MLHVSLLLLLKLLLHVPVKVAAAAAADSIAVALAVILATAPVAALIVRSIADQSDIVTADQTDMGLGFDASFFCMQLNVNAFTCSVYAAWASS